MKSVGHLNTACEGLQHKSSNIHVISIGQYFGRLVEEEVSQVYIRIDCRAGSIYRHRCSPPIGKAMTEFGMCFLEKAVY